MVNRRIFLSSSAAVAGVATLGSGNKARDTDAHPSEANLSRVNGYDYRLPKFQQGCRLLFQGDSITDMKWGRNQSDRNHYLGHSYVYLIAARLGVDMPEARLDFYNRGVSGNTIGDLRRRWQRDGINMKPDLLSILVGTNDAGRNPDGIDVATWEADYRFILDASRKANPDLRLVLLDPFVLRCGKLSSAGAFKQRRDQIERLLPIVARLARDHDAVHVKTQVMFDAAAKAISPQHWIWDGVHPLPQGHELIARNWLQQVSARWH